MVKLYSMYVALKEENVCCYREIIVYLPKVYVRKYVKTKWKLIVLRPCG